MKTITTELKPITVRKKKTEYQCEFCEKLFKSAYDATACEYRHKEDERRDKFLKTPKKFNIGDVVYACIYDEYEYGVIVDVGANEDYDEWIYILKGDKRRFESDLTLFMDKAEFEKCVNNLKKQLSTNNITQRPSISIDEDTGECVITFRRSLYDFQGEAE
jgi:hypothetical protein